MPIKFTDLDPNPMERLLQTCKQLSLVVFSLKLGSREFLIWMSLNPRPTHRHRVGEEHKPKKQLCAPREGGGI